MSTASGGHDEGHRVLGRLRRSPGPGVDPTTGLPDRSQLPVWAQEAVDRSRIRSKRAVVAFVDIGLLRDANDAYGADAGDQLLRSIGARLASIDLPGTRVARHGGAEFALVFEGIDSTEMANEVGRFLIDLLRPGFALGSEQFIVTPTAGLAISSDGPQSPADLVADAHRALVRARDEGSGTWEVHDDSKRGRYDTRIDESRLVAAIDNREFVL